MFKNPYFRAGPHEWARARGGNHVDKKGDKHFQRNNQARKTYSSQENNEATRLFLRKNQTNIIFKEMIHFC